MGPINYDFVRATVADLRHTAQSANRGRLSRWLRKEQADRPAV